MICMVAFLWAHCLGPFWYSSYFITDEQYQAVHTEGGRWLDSERGWQWYVVAVMAVQFWPHLVVQMGVEEQLTQNWCRLIQMCEETIVSRLKTGCWPVGSAWWCKFCSRHEALAKLQLTKRGKSHRCEPNTSHSGCFEWLLFGHSPARLGKL